MSSAPLRRHVALVAGATRGAGRGIAQALGEAGATVYCTGRSSRDGASDLGRPETIEETAKQVTELGGHGIPRVVDHSDTDAVEALIAEIRAEHGRLDLLVNSIWGGDALTEWGTPFWAADVAQGIKMMERAVHTHVITCRYAVPLMLEGGPGLIVEMTDGVFAGYRGQLYYDLCKQSVIRLAYAMSVELRETDLTCVALTPGFMRSEAVLDHFGVAESNWREATGQDPHFAHSETPRLVGRVVAALAKDDEVQARSGQALACWDLAREYGVFDVDGRQPHWDEHLDEAIEDILAKDAPSADDLMLLRLRGSQIDFDPSRADQRERIRELLDSMRASSG